MKRATLTKNLKAQIKWTERQSPKSAKDKQAEQAQDLVTGCFDLCDYLPVDLESWLDRKVYGRDAPRKLLERIRTTFYREQGKKALTGLLQLTLDAVEACRWTDSFPTGCLPVAVRSPDLGGIGKQRISAA